MAGIFDLGDSIKLVRKISDSSGMVTWKGILKEVEVPIRVSFFPDRGQRGLSDIKKISAHLDGGEHFITASGMGLAEEKTPYVFYPENNYTSLRTFIRKDVRDFNILLKISLQLIEIIKILHRYQLFGNRIIPEYFFLDSKFNLYFFPYHNFVRRDIVNFVKHDKPSTEIFYLAPEIIKNFYFEKSSDIYMAGIVLYELITGSVPFFDESSVEILKQHLDSRVPEPEKFAGNLHRQLFFQIMPMLEKDPIERLHYFNDIEINLGRFYSDRASREKYKTLESNIDSADEKIPEEALSAWRDVVYGRGNFFIVQGESGSGKTNWIENLLSGTAADNPGVLFCESGDGEMMRWQGIARLIENLEREYGITEDKDFRHYGKLIDSFLFRGEEPDYGEEPDGEIILRFLFSAVNKFSLRSPLIMVIESFNLWDSESSAVIERIVKEIRHLRLLLILSTENIEGTRQNNRVYIKGLTRNEILNKIMSRLEVKEGEALRIYNQIIAKTGTNPYNINLFLTWWQKYHRSSGIVPHSLFQVLQEIYEGLSEEEKTLLLNVHCWPLGMPLKKKTGQIENLMDLNLIRTRLICGESKIIFSNRLIKKFLETYRSFSDSMCGLFFDWFISSRQKRPWLWDHYLKRGGKLNPELLDELLVTIRKYNILGGALEGIQILEKINTDKFSREMMLKIYRQFFENYSRIGSYENAMQYLMTIEHITEQRGEASKVMAEQIALLIKMDRFLEAEEKLEEIREFPGIDTEMRAEISGYAAQIYLSANNLKMAGKHFTQAYDYFYRNKAYQRVIEISKQLISLYLREGALNDALLLINNALKITARASYRGYRNYFLKLKGDIFYQKNQIVKAAEFYQRALEETRIRQGSEQFAHLLLSKGRIQWLVGDYTNAETYFERAASYFEKSGEDTWMIEARGSIASIYRETGVFGKALSMEKEIERLCREKELISLRIVSLTNLGYIYLDINRNNLARDTFNTAIELARGQNNYKEIYRSILGLVSMYLKENMYGEAEINLKRAEKTAAGIPELFLMNEVRYFRALMAFKGDNLSLAEKAVKIFLRETAISFRYQTMGKLLHAEILLEKNDNNRALDVLGEAFNLARLAGLDPLMVQILWLKSRIHKAADEIRRADSALDQAILVLYKISDSLEDEIERMIFLESLQYYPLWEEAKKRKMED